MICTPAQAGREFNITLCYFIILAQLLISNTFLSPNLKVGRTWTSALTNPTDIQHRCYWQVQRKQTIPLSAVQLQLSPSCCLPGLLGCIHRHSSVQCSPGTVCLHLWQELVCWPNPRVHPHFIGPLSRRQPVWEKIGSSKSKLASRNRAASQCYELCLFYCTHPEITPDTCPLRYSSNPVLLRGPVNPTSCILSPPWCSTVHFTQSVPVQRISRRATRMLYCCFGLWLPVCYVQNSAELLQSCVFVPEGFGPQELRRRRSAADLVEVYTKTRVKLISSAGVAET